MTDVLIVARTRMSPGVCIGGLAIPDNHNVRLMTAGGDYQPATSPFQIGQIYELSYTAAPGEPPHVENVRVTSVGSSRRVVDMVKYLSGRVPVVAGQPSHLFEGKLQDTTNHRPYIGRGELPSGSVQFWRPDRDLLLDGKYYVYGPASASEARFSYAGVAAPSSTIAAGSLVRVSLATWWPSSDPHAHQRCYTQISGWFG